MAEESLAQLKTRVQRLEEENRKWMRLAGIDRLTQLPNSLMLFQVVLPKELSKGKAETFALSCILICPDKLGDINQEHGRVIGDQLIRQLAEFFKKQLELNDRLFHCDGANFAIMMPTKPEGYAKRRAMMVKNLLKNAKFSVDGVEFSDITCSIGTAEVIGEIDKVKISETTDKLYNELCDRLYQAKASGGDYLVGSPKSNRMS
ncbi:MAG TPA: GGDEF domain-containing protein [Candidatus Latescibacteria bacterium]|nr:GGDEF domain-containing protein [Candidatus Latescibacterota bacterium]